MKEQEKQVINGKFLYYAFLAGSRQILNHQTEINHINVYPVNDKDTGTNMASTVRSIIDNIKPNKSYKSTLNDIANSALIGARGNSGAIFAQFLLGMSIETKNIQVISLPEFTNSVVNSIPYIYEAIENPVEGTMLTVIKDWSVFLNSKKNDIYGFGKVIIDSLQVLEKSLTETTSKLKILSKHAVVDAGAKGFVVFIKGIIDFINNRNIRDLSAENNSILSFIHSEDMDTEDIQFRYCTEALIKDVKIEKSALRTILTESGDSVVIAGTERVSRIHVHTNTPSELFYKIKDSGTVTFQKVDDMVRQNEIATKRKWNIALVTDSTCDLSQELIDFYQINVVPLNIFFGDNHYLDKITIQPNQFYDLLESKPEFPKTSQINERTFINLYSHLASHYDAIISLHLTGHFSGTYSNSFKAAEKIKAEFNKPVFVIDSKNLSGALGLLILKAAESIEKGESADSIVNNIKSDIKNAHIFVSVENLKYMIKGGRVSKPKGKLANFLGINPVISIDENGKSILFGKTFSQQESLNLIFKHIEKMSKNRNVWNYIILHAHNTSGAKLVENKMLEITGKPPKSIVNISPVIGMHAGKGAVAVSLLYNN